MQSWKEACKCQKPTGCHELIGHESTLRSYSDTIRKVNLSLREKSLLEVWDGLNTWLSLLPQSLSIAHTGSHSSQSPHLNCMLSLPVNNSCTNPIRLTTSRILCYKISGTSCIDVSPNCYCEVRSNFEATLTLWLCYECRWTIHGLHRTSRSSRSLRLLASTYDPKTILFSIHWFLLQKVEQIS